MACCTRPARWRVQGGPLLRSRCGPAHAARSGCRLPGASQQTPLPQKRPRFSMPTPRPSFQYVAELCGRVRLPGDAARGVCARWWLTREHRRLWTRWGPLWLPSASSLSVARVRALAVGRETVSLGCFCPRAPRVRLAARSTTARQHDTTAASPCVLPAYISYIYIICDI